MAAEKGIEWIPHFVPMARTEIVAVAICFPEESMLLITDFHMNTWNLNFTNVTNILCVRCLFFSFKLVLCWTILKNSGHLMLLSVVRMTKLFCFILEDGIFPFFGSQNWEVHHCTDSVSRLSTLKSLLGLQVNLTVWGYILHVVVLSQILHKFIFSQLYYQLCFDSGREIWNWSMSTTISHKLHHE